MSDNTIDIETAIGSEFKKQIICRPGYQKWLKKSKVLTDNVYWPPSTKHDDIIMAECAFSKPLRTEAYYRLSVNGRVAIKTITGLSLIDSIEVPCAQPQNIKSVIMYMVLSFPKDKEDRNDYWKYHLSEKNDGKGYFWSEQSLGFGDQYIYIPIRKFINTLQKPFKINIFKLYDEGPLPRVNFPYNTFSIEVKYNKSYIIPPEYTTIKLNYFTLGSPLFKRDTQNKIIEMYREDPLQLYYCDFSKVKGFREYVENKIKK